MFKDLINSFRKKPEPIDRTLGLIATHIALNRWDTTDPVYKDLVFVLLSIENELIKVGYNPTMFKSHVEERNRDPHGFDQHDNDPVEPMDD